MEELTIEEQKIKDLIKKTIREELGQFLGYDKYTFQKGIKIFDGRHITSGRTKGTKIATGTDQKIGFYGITPVDQPATVADFTPNLGSGSDHVNFTSLTDNFTNVQTAINAIIDRLQELGLIA